MLESIHLGLGSHDAALLVNRVALGLFFALSGYHKLFNAGRHASMRAVLVESKVPCVWFNEWWVPCVEFFGGIAVLIGLLSALAASGLLVICGVAVCVDGIKRIPAFKPIDKADYVDDVLYLPEVVYIVMAAIVILAGPGAFSLDHLIFA